ncbi:MAG: N-acetyltransferase [Rubrobacteraceae bacterium]
MGAQSASGSTTTNIRPVESRADLTRFIKYPFEKYRDDPHWVPPLIFDERRKFDPRKNPFYEHARVAPMLAERGGKVVGRVAAIDDDNHNITHGDNLIFFGFFEAADQAAADALLNRVEEWGSGLGRDAVRGPANPSMNDGSGFQIDAFDTTPFVMMPYNPSQYPGYAEAAGYEKAKDLYAYLFERDWDVGEKIGRLARLVRRRYEPAVRTASLKNFDAELKLLKRLYNEGWVENWGFVKYTEAEFDRLASELKLVVDPELIVFVEVEGEVAGLGLCLPDVNQVLKKARGRLFPSGLLAFLNRRRIVDQLRLVILGITPEYRGKGLEAVIIDELYRNAIPKGYQRCECSWVLEDNKAIMRSLEAAGAKLYKTYRIYQKAL